MNTKSRSSLIIAIIVCLIAITAISSRATREQQTDTTVRVENKLHVLQIMSIRQVPLGNGMTRVFNLEVMNISDKAIVSYVLRNKNGSSITSTGASTGWSLAPGATNIDTISVNGNEGLPILFAALLEDGTGDGDSQEVSRMRDYRAGVEKQFQRSLPILRGARNTPESARASAVLDDLQNRLSALPEEAVGPNVSPGMASGIQHAKEFIIFQLKPLKNKLKDSNGINLQTVQTDVGELLTHIEEAQAKLQNEKSGNRSISSQR